MNEITEQNRPRQRADGSQVTLSPSDRRVLLLAIDAYKTDLQRKGNKVKGKHPDIYDQYIKLINEADKTLKAIG